MIKEKEEILFFSAPWCGPCGQVKKMLSESDLGDLDVKIVDISDESNMNLVVENNILNVPTFVKTVGGKEVSRKIGSVTITDLKNL